MKKLQGPFVLVFLASCAGTSHVLDGDADPRRIAAEFAEADVAFLGEVHDSDSGHALQLAILQDLYARRPNLVVAMEMFERDVQPKLDAYLAGTCTETEMLAATRPWPNYQKHYRPIIEFAKAHHLRVIAANVPRDVARKLSREGAGAGSPFAAKETTAPRDAYWVAFQKAINEDAPSGLSEDQLFRMYQAQCLKDDTMAESIAEALLAEPRPLVVHLCGAFHASHRLGTAARVLARRPDARIGVLSMQTPKKGEHALTQEQAQSGDFVVHVRDSKDEASKPGKPNPHQVAVAVSQPSTKIALPDADERPGLGLMPDYESGGMGMGVASVRDDGPAAKAGIQTGDVIVRFAGEEVKDASTYMQALQQQRVGNKVQVELLRGGKVVKLEATIGVSRR